VRDLLRHEPTYGALVPEAAERDALARVFLDVPLPQQLAVKITVAREQRPAVLSHAVRVAWLAAVIATKSSDESLSVTDAVAAGLFHDLGLLHIDPELLAPGRALRDTEWQHLQAHPVIASAMLEKIAGLSSQVGRAVREHHERLDGSGYPRALKKGKLGALGQVVAVADVSAKLLDEPAELTSATRPSIILRFSHDKLNQRYVSALQCALPPDDLMSSATGSVDSGGIFHLLVRLASALQHWQKLKVGRRETPPST
jgi:HD superfamily phosphohydrolase YqeK